MSLAVLATCRSPLPPIKVRTISSYKLTIILSAHILQKAGACIVYQEPRRAVSVGYSGYIDGMSDGKKEENGMLIQCV